MTWKTLRHPNVLPLLGVSMDNGEFAMASNWMINGNINQFVEVDWAANRFELVGHLCRRSLRISFFGDYCLNPIVQGCRSGVGIYA